MLIVRRLPLHHRAAVVADMIGEEEGPFTEEVAESDCSDEEQRAISITPDFSPANLASLQKLLRLDNSIVPAVHHV